MTEFVAGGKWLRADFHLHTKADKEFIYKGNENEFVKLYIEKLIAENIGVGIITNHNKFDLYEYKALRKRAKKENIFLFPGVELSITDGAGQIHCLVVFDANTWFDNKSNENFVEQFLTSAFEGAQNREHENTACNYNLNDLLKKLAEHKNKGRDSFVIMAHIERDKGFLKEFQGNRIEQFGRNPLFGQFVLGLQQARTNDLINKFEQWLYVKGFAYVEGSDCKNLDAVGQAPKQNDIAKKTFIKIGDFDFKALKFAFENYPQRIKADTIEATPETFIRKLKVTSNKLNNSLIFNNQMNNLIGIRGSGKSTIIEILRYILGENPRQDADYKNRLLENFIGNGGEVELTLLTKDKEYTIKKSFGEDITTITDKHGTELNFSVSQLLENRKILYFGQKDLSYRETDSNEVLFEKLLPSEVKTIRQNIEQKNAEIKEILSYFKKYKDIEGRKKEEIEEKNKLEHNLNLFKEKAIDKKLDRQVNFQKDLTNISSSIVLVEKMTNELVQFINKYNLDIQTYKILQTDENTETAKVINTQFEKIENNLNTITGLINELKTSKDLIGAERNKLQIKYKQLLDEFSEIKRQINEPNLKADDFLKYTNLYELVKLKLVEINKIIAKKAERTVELKENLNDLESLWLSEYNMRNNKQVEVNAQNNAISVNITYKGNKNAFEYFLAENLKGTNIRKYAYTEIAKSYNDCIEIYHDIQKGEGKIYDILSSGNLMENFKSMFMEYISDFVTYRPLDKIEILYNGKNLADYSIGQRASAIILFLFSQQKNDIVLIDQPEDDLDNQSIYNEIIKEILDKKKNTQFIFATHNPNIPVLGDCEQIFACYNDDNQIKFEAGSIDNKAIQTKIMEIMEGGSEAFDKRNSIYNSWKH